MVSFHNNGTVTKIISQGTGHVIVLKFIRSIMKRIMKKNCSLTKKEKGVAGRIYHVVIGLTVYT